MGSCPASRVPEGTLEVIPLTKVCLDYLLPCFQTTFIYPINTYKTILYALCRAKHGVNGHKTEFVPVRKDLRVRWRFQTVRRQVNKNKYELLLIRLWF